MVHVDRSIIIAAPHQDVWDFVADPARYPEWVDVDTVEVLGDAGDLGEGTRYREVGHIGPKEIVTEFEIVKWEPPHRQVHTTETFGGTSTLTVEVLPVGEHTQLRLAAESHVLRQVRPLGWLIEHTLLQRFVSTQLQRNLLNAKAILEDREDRTE